MIWCPIDRCYYCLRCYNTICKPVHGTKPAIRQQGRMIGIGALVLFGSALLPFAAALILTPTAWQGPTDSATIGIALILPFIVGILWLALSNGIRRILGVRAVIQHPPINPEGMADTPDPGLSWRPNRAAFPRRLTTLLFIIAAAAAIDAALILFAPSNGAPAALRAVEGAIVVVTMIGGIASLLAALPFAIPSEIAVADDGVHFWYQSVYDRRLLRETLPWVDLNILAMSSAQAIDPMKRLVRFLRIDSENASLLASEWARHRIDRTPSRRSTASEDGLEAASSLERVPARPSPVALEGSVTVSQRGAVCARCYVRFPALEGLRLLWCRIDGFYVCRRCWREGCREGHGRGMRSVSKPARIATGVVVVLAFLAVWYPTVSYDNALTGTWHDGPVVPLSALHAGELAKVAGTIESTSLIAWGGHERYTSQNGWWWTWNSTDAFDLSDGTATILVTTQVYYIGYNGPHLASYATHTEMWVYESGDGVQIVGTVAQVGTGALVLEAQIVSQNQAVSLISLAPSPLETSLAFLIPVLMIGLVVGGAAVFLTRRMRTRAAIQGHAVLSLDTVEVIRDPNLNWLPNGRGTTPKSRAAWAGGSLLVGIGFLAVFPGFGPRAEFGYTTLGFVGTIVVAIAGVAVYTLLFAGWGRPGFVAVADDGFRLWFDSPYDRHLNETLFPWGDIRDIHMTGGKTPHWVLRWTSGELTNLYMLKGANLTLLLTEWTKRKMAQGKRSPANA